MVDSIKVWFTGKARDSLPVCWRASLPEAKAVRFWNDGQGNFKAEVSLPKLLFGHNGRLLANQIELNESLARLRSILSQRVDFDSWQFVLIDLCWQFEARASDVILAHQWLPFPGVRSLPSLFNGGKEISWRGGKSQLSLKFYDKAKAFHTGEGVLRVELRLTGEQLRKRIDEHGQLDFRQLWQVFRAEVIGLDPVDLPEERRHSFAEVVAAVEPKAQSVALLAYRQERSSRAANDFERAVSAARLKNLSWNWRDILPINGPLPPVHVQPRPRGTKR